MAPLTFRTTAQAHTGQARHATAAAFVLRGLLTRHGKSVAVSAPAAGKELWNLHVDRLSLWLWLIARLTTVATLIGLLRLLRVVPPLTGWRTCEQTLISEVADMRVVSEKPHPQEDNIAAVVGRNNLCRTWSKREGVERGAVRRLGWSESGLIK